MKHPRGCFFVRIKGGVMDLGGIEIRVDNVEEFTNAMREQVAKGLEAIGMMLHVNAGLISVSIT